MAPQGPLGKDKSAVHPHFEHPACGFDQADVGVGEGLMELGSQTGGPGLVVSNQAVFDRDLHRSV